MLALSLLTAAVLSSSPAMVRVGPGVVHPLWATDPRDRDAPVAAFLLDERAVTNGELLAFVRAHPEWRRDRVARLFADEGYLERWAGPQVLGPRAPAEAPVVDVSWFVARAYCASRHARLPSENEWELAAAADERQADAHADPAFVERLLAWYGQPTPAVLPPAGRGARNVWGARELHGLIWEWVLDYGNDMLGEDSRGGGASARFCGGGAWSNGDKRDYAAFMRAAFRSALQANDTTANLGFRCAADDRSSP